MTPNSVPIIEYVLLENCCIIGSVVPSLLKGNDAVCCLLFAVCYLLNAKCKLLDDGRLWICLVSTNKG